MQPGLQQAGLFYRILLWFTITPSLYLKLCHEVFSKALQACYCT
jgi:hypothetical protein